MQYSSVVPTNALFLCLCLCFSLTIQNASLLTKVVFILMHLNFIILHNLVEISWKNLFHEVLKALISLLKSLSTLFALFYGPYYLKKYISYLCADRSLCKL